MILLGCHEICFNGSSKSLQANAPKVVEKGDELLEAFGPQRVQPPRASAPLAQEACVEENADVLRDGRPRNREVVSDLAGREFVVSNDLEDFASAGLCDRSKRGVHARV